MIAVTGDDEDNLVVCQLAKVRYNAARTIARERGVDIPVLGSLLNSNDAHIGRAYDLIAAHGRKPIALFGLAFKPGTAPPDTYSVIGYDAEEFGKANKVTPEQERGLQPGDPP